MLKRRKCEQNTYTCPVQKTLGSATHDLELENNKKIIENSSRKIENLKSTTPEIITAEFEIGDNLG